MSDFTYVDHIDLDLINLEEYAVLEDTSWECEYPWHSNRSGIRYDKGYYLCAEHYALLAGYTQDDAKLIEYAKEMQHVRP